MYLRFHGRKMACRELLLQPAPFTQRCFFGLTLGCFYSHRHQFIRKKKQFCVCFVLLIWTPFLSEAPLWSSQPNAVSFLSDAWDHQKISSLTVAEAGVWSDLHCSTSAFQRYTHPALKMIWLMSTVFPPSGCYQRVRFQSKFNCPIDNRFCTKTILSRN